MNNDLNKVQFTTDDDRYELTLPIKCNFYLEKNIETGRYDITLKEFSNLREGDIMSYTVSGDTIEECILSFGQAFLETPV